MSKVITWIVVIVIIVGGMWWLLSKGNSSNTTPTSTTDTSSATQTTDTAGTGADTSANPPTTTTTGTNTTATAVKEFTVNGGNFYFKPATITVKLGDTVKINFVNDAGTHDFVIDELGVRTPRIAGGQSASVQFVANKAGSFEYYCSVGEHRSMGMKGTLVVTP